jgi:histidine triad (HIT) family protein
MPSIFTRIIQGQLPGRFLWRDEKAVAFLTIAPIKPGHALVVPIEEVDHWLDASPELNAHLMGVAQKVGAAIQEAFNPKKVGMIIAGIEVPHVHLHLIPIHELHDLDFSRAIADPPPEMMDDAAEKIRSALRAAGHSEVCD